MVRGSSRDRVNFSQSGLLIDSSRTRCLDSNVLKVRQFALPADPGTRRALK